MSCQNAASASNLSHGRNSSIDLLKIVLSVIIMMIHSEVSFGFFLPFIWAAIPVFFIISGYFFFHKQKQQKSDADRRFALLQFLKRNMKLYLFWFCMLLPITLYVRNWFSGSFGECILNFLKDFLFNSTFRGSWYIMALNIGVIIVFLLSKRISTENLLRIFLVVHVICCLFSAYYGLVADHEMIIAWYEAYLEIFRSLHNGFPMGLFWIALGKYLAEKNRKYEVRKSMKMLVISALLLLLEHICVAAFGLPKTHHAYLMHIPFCAALFCVIKNAKIRDCSSLRLGQVSTIFYTLHTSVVVVVGFVVRKFCFISKDLTNWIVFFATLILCILGCRLIFCLENKKGFRWLRCAY